MVQWDWVILLPGLLFGMQTITTLELIKVPANQAAKLGLLELTTNLIGFKCLCHKLKQLGKLKQEAEMTITINLSRAIL